MPAPPKIQRYSPSFLRFPVQNARTGYQPVYIPLILIVPGRKLPNGTRLANSGVISAKYYIQDAPDSALVAGFEHRGLRVPSQSLFTLNITNLMLADVYLDITGYGFYNPSDPTTKKTFEQAVEGDVFDYTTIVGKITSTIPFYPDADYYDLSKFSIDVVDLPAPKSYIFVWEVDYYSRIIIDDINSAIQGPFCISDNVQITRFNMLYQHPGDVHFEMIRKTPAFFFTEGITLKNSPVVQFYRALADVLQDITDEQEFLNGINHINKIPAQLLPYLSYIIGWDLPNFLGSTDSLRRAILRYAVTLQKLKGSKRAIVELFSIFGFEIDLLNLWYSTDGKKLIAPGEKLPATYKSQQILVRTVCQIDPLISNYNTDSFGVQVIPLIHKATGNISVIALQVSDGTLINELNNLITQLSLNPDFLIGKCGVSPKGFLISDFIQELLIGSNAGQILAFSEVLIDSTTGEGVAYVGSQPPIINQTISYNNVENVINFKFDHHMVFGTSKLFVFALYERQLEIVPLELLNLRSNRFDVNIISRVNGDDIDTDTIQYLLGYLYRLKAFHSLLRKIIFKLNLLDVYNVTDWCSPDFNNLQVPPPQEKSIPTSKCNESLASGDPNDKAYNLKLDIYRALTDEFENWKALDKTHSGGGTLEPTPARLNPIVKINTPTEKTITNSCQFTKYGQDRVVADFNTDFDQTEDTRESLCAIISPTPDFCFKGRVQAEVNVDITMILNEIIRCKPCSLGVGSGFYWLIPTNDSILKLDGFGRYKGQNNHSFLGSKIDSYNHPSPKALKYSDRPYLQSDEFEKNTYLGYQRPNLEIQKDNHLFPSHRFPNNNNLLNDFTSEWAAKPWDNKNDDLNAKLIIGTDGDQYLIYDSKNFIIKGNGLLPDISSYSVHDDRSFVVTHKIYIASAANHPAIELDSSIVILTNDDGIELNSSVPFGPIFKSYNRNCNRDFKSGYPAEYDRFSITYSDFDYTRGSNDPISWSVISEITSLTAFPDTELFRFGSEILVTSVEAQYEFYKPYRYDCDCAIYPCISEGSTGVNITEFTSNSFLDIKINVESCMLDRFLQPDGSYDFNCDQLSVIPKIVLNETIGTCSFQCNGEIDNYLCTIPGPGISKEGTSYYKDEYNIVYEMSWKYLDKVTLDITSIVKSPHVWGEPDSGYIVGRKLYVRGIITTTRQILKTTGIGKYELVAQWLDQIIDYFLLNPACGDRQFKDNFCYHYDCSIIDEPILKVLCGSRWADLSDVVIWPELILNTSGVVVGIEIDAQPFQWVNVWKNDDDLVSVCTAASVGS